jgi:3-dehydroquinate synthase
MNRTLTVALGERGYPIEIGTGLIGRPEVWTAIAPGRQVLLLSNTTIAPLYAPALRAALGERPLELLLLPDGESHKTLEQAGVVFQRLAAMGASRDAVLVALGGGVIGDLGGFVAATWMRGIDFVQVPTTLLAMVDSSVGGKTAVNLPAGKNLVGAFHQPRRVVADLDTLATLPPREYASGLAEVLKYGAIVDPEFFDWIDGHAAALVARDVEAVAGAVLRSCRHKAAIVARDERETGDRALLNFGHTFGHALEAVAGYGTLLHGEAVAIGMVQAARLSERLGLAPATDGDRLAALLSRLGLPTTPPPGLPADALEHAMRLDKKNASGQLRFILWRGIGAALLPQPVANEALRAVL